MIYSNTGIKYSFLKGVIAVLAGKIKASLLCGLVACLFYPIANAAEAIAQMVWTKGNVIAVASDRSSRTLVRRSPIFLNDTVVTNATSTGEIIFTDGSVVSLRNNTTYSINQYHFDSQGRGSDNEYDASLSTGGFRTLTGWIPKNNPRGYKVNTPVATIGVRGTDYSIFYDAAGLAVRLNKGALVIANRAGQVELNHARNLVYAQISGLNHMPKITNAPAPSIRSQPSITGISLRSSQQSTLAVPSSQGGEGGSHTVKGFCIQ